MASRPSAFANRRTSTGLGPSLSIADASTDVKGFHGRTRRATRTLDGSSHGETTSRLRSTGHRLGLCRPRGCRYGRRRRPRGGGEPLPHRTVRGVCEASGGGDRGRRAGRALGRAEDPVGAGAGRVSGGPGRARGRDAPLSGEPDALPDRPRRSPIRGPRRPRGRRDGRGRAPGPAGPATVCLAGRAGRPRAVPPPPGRRPETGPRPVLRRGDRPRSRLRRGLPRLGRARARQAGLRPRGGDTPEGPAEGRGGPAIPLPEGPGLRRGRSSAVREVAGRGARRSTLATSTASC